MILDGWRSRFVRYLGWFHQIHYIERKATGWVYMVREKTDKKKRPPGQTHRGQKSGKRCPMHRNEKRNKSGLSRNQSSTNARRLRGTYFIDPEDKEFKDIMKKARRKLEIPMPAAMPCKIHRKSYRETCRVVEKKCKTKYACIVEAKSLRIRMEGAPHRYHEDHIAGKGMNSLSHYNPVHKFIPMPQAMNIPDAKAAVDKAWEKLEKIPAWQLTKVRDKNEK